MEGDQNGSQQQLVSGVSKGALFVHIANLSVDRLQLIRKQEQQRQMQQESLYYRVSSILGFMRSKARAAATKYVIAWAG